MACCGGSGSKPSPIEVYYWVYHISIETVDNRKDLAFLCIVFSRPTKKDEWKNNKTVRGSTRVNNLQSVVHYLV